MNNSPAVSTQSPPQPNQGALAGPGQHDALADAALVNALHRPPPSVETVQRLFPHYLIDRFIGSGSTAAVYLVRDEATHATRALKIPVALNDIHCQRRLETEAKLMNELHTGSPTRFPSATRALGEQFGLLVDLAPASLTSAIASRRGDYRYLLDRFFECCDAISEMHKKEILHADIKPSAFRVGRDGAMCVDLNLVSGVSSERWRSEGSIQFSQSLVANKDTRAEFKGVVAYWAPEQSRGEICRASNILSLGVMLYELASGGKLPDRKYPPLTGEVASLNTVIDTALQPEIANRPQSIEAFKQLIRESELWKATYSTTLEGQTFPQRTVALPNQQLSNVDPTAVAAIDALENQSNDLRRAISTLENQVHASTRLRRRSFVAGFLYSMVGGSPELPKSAQDLDDERKLGVLSNEQTDVHARQRKLVLENARAHDPELNRRALLVETIQQLKELLKSDAPTLQKVSRYASNGSIDTSELALFADYLAEVCRFGRSFSNNIDAFNIALPDKLDDAVVRAQIRIEAFRKESEENGGHPIAFPPVNVPSRGVISNIVDEWNRLKEIFRIASAEIETAGESIERSLKIATERLDSRVGEVKDALRYENRYSSSLLPLPDSPAARHDTPLGRRSTSRPDNDTPLGEELLDLIAQGSPLPNMDSPIGRLDGGLGSPLISESPRPNDDSHFGDDLLGLVDTPRPD